jgi:putative endonuclease
MLTNYTNKLLYVGMTSNLPKRIHQHKSKYFPGFTNKYNINKLVYYEEYSWANDATKRERQLKGFVRRKKDKLINEKNPEWKELIIPFI